MTYHHFFNFYFLLFFKFKYLSNKDFNSSYQLHSSPESSTGKVVKFMTRYPAVTACTT